MSFDRRQGQERQKRPAQLMPEDRQKILAALSNVFHTPQASGIPTNNQNSAALASSPPLPMPNERCWIAAPLLALAACSLATSASLMCHLGLTSLIRKLKINPAASIAHRMYMVLS